MKIPQYHEMFNAVLQALRELGGSGSIEEMNNKVIELQNYSTDVVDVLHGEGPATEIEYRLAWARTYLKNMVYWKIPAEEFGQYQIIRTI